MKQNFAISLDKEVIRKSKILAARKATSISKLLAGIVDREDLYEASKRSGLHTLRKGFRLGGARKWRREDFYER